MDIRKLVHKEYIKYLNDIVGDQRANWINPAIASHLRFKFKELTKHEYLIIVKHFVNDKEAEIGKSGCI